MRCAVSDIMNYYSDQDIIEVSVKDVTSAPPNPPTYGSGYKILYYNPPTCGSGYKMGAWVMVIVTAMMILPIIHHVAVVAIQPPCDENTAVCYKLF